MADLNKKALLEIDLDLDALNKGAAEAKDKVAALVAQMKALKDAGQQNTAQYVALQGQQKAYQAVVNSAVLVNQKLTQAQNQNTGSVLEMRSQLSVITAQYNSLSAAERQTADVGGKLLTQQAQLSKSLSEIEEAGGNSTRAIGSYKKSIEDALAGMNPFESQLAAIVQGFNSLKQASAESQAAQEAATAANVTATDALTSLSAANEAVVIAQASLAEAEANVAALQAADTVSTEALTAAQTEAATAAAALAAAQEVQAGASAASAAANEGAAAASATAAGGFKLFDTILKASIIGAIAAIILLLINYLRTFKPVVDVVESAFAALNAVVNFVVSALKSAVQAFSNVGNVIKALGDFFTHPIDSLKKFGEGMAEAAASAYKLKQAQIELEDQMKASDVQTAASAQKVSALILQARNRSISNEDRQKLLAQAAKLDQDDYDRRKKLSDQEIANATEQARIEGELSKEQLDLVRKNGTQALVDLQNDSKVRGKITDDTIDAFKKAELNRIAILQESTNQQEKIQNRSDQSADRAEKQREAAAAKAKTEREKAQKQDDDRVIAEQKTRELLESGRQAETDKLNIEYNKRVQAARGYAKTIEAIEIERQAALKKLNDGFAIVDAKQQNDNNNTRSKNQISALTRQNEELTKVSNDYSTEAQKVLVDNLKQAHDIQAQQDAENLAYQLNQKDLTKQQIQAIEEKYNQDELDNDNKFKDDKLAITQELADKRVQQIKSEQDAVSEFERAKRSAYSQGIDLLINIFGKQTILGKAAFLAQKALAIAEIVIQTQKQVAAIELSAAYQSASAASTLPFFLSIPAIVGIQAFAAARVILAEVSGAIQIAAIVAQAVQGFAKGGVYESDGLGGALPGYSKTDNINSRLRSGEGVVVAEAMRDPKARQIVSAINVDYGGRSFGQVNHTGGFATGGLFTQEGLFGTQFSSGTDISTISHAIQRTAQAVANNIPQTVLVIDDVERKLSDQQGIDVRSTI